MRGPHEPLARAVARRDDNLARTRKLTGWIVSGAAAASFALAGALGYALPGHSYAATTPTGQTGSVSGQHGTTGGADGAGAGGSGAGGSGAGGSGAGGSGATGSGSGGQNSNGGTSNGGGGLAPPQQPPTTSTAPPVVSSGGS